MKAHYSHPSLKVIKHADGGSYLYWPGDQTDAEKSAARDAALRDIAAQLRAAGVMHLVIARDRIAEYRTATEAASRRTVRARNAHTTGALLRAAEAGE
jgi:hypothetical protein